MSEKITAFFSVKIMNCHLLACLGCFWPHTFFHRSVFIQHTCTWNIFHDNIFIQGDDKSGEIEDLQEEKDVVQDTVGAVVMDTRGNIASAVSSGGISLKQPGRLGPVCCWISLDKYSHSKARFIDKTKSWRGLGQKDVRFKKKKHNRIRKPVDLIFLCMGNHLCFKNYVIYKFIWFQAAIYGAGCWAYNQRPGKPGVGTVTSGKNQV